MQPKTMFDNITSPATALKIAYIAIALYKIRLIMKMTDEQKIRNKQRIQNDTLLYGVPALIFSGLGSGVKGNLMYWGMNQLSQKGSAINKKVTSVMKTLGFGK
jgi:hypothetical protein